MNTSSQDPHNHTRNEDELGRTNAYSQQGDDSFDVMQGEDDINKYNKLESAFKGKFKENNAFIDTFTDEKIYDKTPNSEDYLRISVDLLKYIMHTSNRPKKVVEKKKPGMGMLGK